MAPAHVARASTNTDSIKGLAQSLAKPAYRRLLVAEPALRRAVPLLIITFLFTMAVGTGVQIFDHHREASVGAVDGIELFADYLASRLDGEAARPQGQRRNAQDIIAMALERRGGRTVLVADGSGTITAAAPARAAVGHTLVDVLGPDQPLTTFGATAGALETPLSDGTTAIVTVRNLHSPPGQLAIIDPMPQAISIWRSDTTLAVTLSATTGFVVLILGFAFHWQSTRAREADLIHENVRRRVDTALNRGRCGLWDWDLARGRVFWSHSMFAILGQQPRDNLLTFGEVNDLVHPDDVSLYALASQIAEGRTQSIDRAFRMRHADGHWVWLRARCEITRQARRHRLPPARHRRRHHRAEGDGGADRGRRRAAARRHRDDSRGFRAVGRRQPAGALQLELPGAVRPAGRGGGLRDALRQDRRRRAPASAAQHGCRRARRRRARRAQAIPAHELSRPSSTTAAGSTSASDAPRTAATSRSAPTSPRSSFTRRG